MLDALSERISTSYAYYESNQHLGEVAHELVINSKGRRDHLATKLLELLPSITRPFTQAGREAFELLQAALLSEVDADSLFKAGLDPTALRGHRGRLSAFRSASQGQRSAG
ncbi:hypothetical protein SJI00_18005 [Pseudomonas sp. RP23018S]|uniref:hypothetical protein n=1 Tax=Pseudomonas sp. RP23018S TaxID=3096037 RepID=UPI002ACA7029|nr:hypothetical protein [Pseudomonas sp. RP23018S]MDZ5604665.1 hypothetical protein [Pseudomonas sp. RP23018S]